ncbi:MAG: ribosomal protein S18-alanine N-acetyltransferase [Gammaproteobacteria bacterium]|nr:ribosomal protein S18-alanine N-acetyltransferase [Gammaproteobacteria bacterium]
MRNMDDFPAGEGLNEPVDYRFRKMSAQDLADVLAIERKTYEFPWSETIFKDCLRVNYHCYVIESVQQVMGYAVMTVAAGESHILNICVDESLRGSGIGRSMLAHLVDRARSHRAEMMLLEVRASNTVAIDLYLNSDFNEIGRRNAYYPAKNGREDALILARIL